MLLNSKKSLKYKLLQDGKTRGDELQVPETTVRAYFSQIENDSPTTNTFLTFSTNILCPCMYTRGES